MLKPSIAVLIDAENVPARLMPGIMQCAKRIGDPVLRCAFGDFSSNRLAEWVEMAREFAMEIVFQPSGGKGKNSTDIAMAVRTMDLLHENVFSGFCLVSSDRDFRPLAQRLIRSGKEIYGIGEAKADPALQAAFTSFFILKDAPEKTPAVSEKAARAKSTSVTPKSRFTDFDLQQIEAIIGRIAGDENGWVALEIVAQAVRRQDLILANCFCGKGKFRGNLRDSQLVTEKVEGSVIKVRLKRRPAISIDALVRPDDSRMQ